MRESRTYGSARGAWGNPRPYRDRSIKALATVNLTLFSDIPRRRRRRGKGASCRLVHCSKCCVRVTSFNHLVRAQQEFLGNGEAERLCGLEVDHELDLG